MDIFRQVKKTLRSCIQLFLCETSFLRDLVTDLCHKGSKILSDTKKLKS